MWCGGCYQDPKAQAVSTAPGTIAVWHVCNKSRTSWRSGLLHWEINIENWLIWGAGCDGLLTQKLQV